MSINTRKINTDNKNNADVKKCNVSGCMDKLCNARNKCKK